MNSLFKNNKAFTSKQGFTLIELLVVIAIIALLSSVVAASLVTAREKAKVGRTIAQVRELSTALRMYNNDVGDYPDQPCIWDCTAGRDPLITNVGNKAGWAGPYISKSGSFSSALSGWNAYIGYDVTTYDDNGQTHKIPMVVIGNGPRVSEGQDAVAGKPISWASLKKLDQIIDDGNISSGRAVVLYYTEGTYMDSPGGVFNITVDDLVK